MFSAEATQLPLFSRESTGTKGRNKKKQGCKQGSQDLKERRTCKRSQRQLIDPFFLEKRERDSSLDFLIEKREEGMSEWVKINDQLIWLLFFESVDSNGVSLEPGVKRVAAAVASFSLLSLSRSWCSHEILVLHSISIFFLRRGDSFIFQNRMLTKLTKQKQQLQWQVSRKEGMKRYIEDPGRILLRSKTCLSCVLHFLTLFDSHLDLPSREDK